MNVDPRWSIHPRQRGRYGVPGLHLPNRPVANELAFDKIAITVPCRLIAVDAGPSGDEQAWEGYRTALRTRAWDSQGQWTQPGNGRTGFESQLKWPDSTIGGATIRAHRLEGAYSVSLKLTVNPTRTLVHALSTADHDHHSLRNIDTARFFARSPLADAALSLDHRDNAVGNVDDVLTRLGPDHAAAFIGIFEDKLKHWAMEAVAPSAEGFTWDLSGDVPIARSRSCVLILDWDRLFIRNAEIYCERRCADAVALMNRLTSAVLAAHAEVQWRTYPIAEFGGRQGGSTAIGVRLTGRVDQVFYAKTRDRIRIETRYTHRVRDNLRGGYVSPCNPLHDMLIALRGDAVARIQWDHFCSMAAEPPIPSLVDFARLSGVVAQCAVDARVRAEPVFAELFGTGGITETEAHGPFPRRLMRRLTDHGLIHRDSLTRRSRPGQPRRHHLLQPYLSIAEMVQQMFGPLSVPNNSAILNGPAIGLDNG